MAYANFNSLRGRLNVRMAKKQPIKAVLLYYLRSIISNVLTSWMNLSNTSMSPPFDFLFLVLSLSHDNSHHLPDYSDPKHM